MARPSRPTPVHTAELLRRVAAVEKCNSLAIQRLTALFPELAARLAAALKATRAHHDNAELACRHYLCMEALTEVLEERVQDGRGCRGDSRGKIVEEYTQRVPAKLLAWPRRPAAERRTIQAACPKVDLLLVRRALRKGVLQPEFVAGVLEDPVDYRGLLSKLNGSAPGRKPQRKAAASPTRRE